MLVGVAAVISQTKWTWFSRPRPLSHVQYFDEASRSVSGSLSLLFVAPTSTLGVLSAIITILSLGMGPFTQQTIRTVECLKVHDELNASLPMAHFVPGNGTYYRIGAGMFEVQVDMKGTMVNGIVNPTGNDSAIIPTCATGNCTFAQHDSITHSSMAMCSSCIDTTSLVSGPSGVRGNYTLPNNMWVAPVSDMAFLNVNRDNLTWAASVFTPEFASVSRWALANVTVLSLTTATCSNDGGKLNCPMPNGYGGPTGLVATSCSLYPCLKNYAATIERGVLSEKIVSTQPAPINYVEAASMDPSETSSFVNYTALRTPCQVDGDWYDLPDFSNVPKTDGRTFTEINIDGTNYTAPDDCTYKMLSPYATALSTFMGYNLLSGVCTYNSRQGQAISCGERWWLSSLYQDKEASFESLSMAFDQFATAVTNKFRTTGSSIYDTSTHETVNGRVNEMTVCTMFQWEWLLMPTILVAATAAVLIVMISQNLRDHEQPVWKSSLLPLLYYGIHHKGSGQNDPHRPAMNLTEMNQAASEVKATFRDGTDAGFVDVTNHASLDQILRQRARDADVDSLIDRG